MRVLMIVASFPPLRCGVGDYTEQLCKSLVADGIEVEVVTSEPRTQNLEPRTQNFTVYRVIKRWGFGAFFPILRLIKEMKPRVVHIQYHGDDYERRMMVNLLPFILRFLGVRCRVVTTLHNLQKTSVFPKFGMKTLLGFSERLILTNEIDRNELVEKFPFTVQKATVIPAGPGTPRTQNLEPRTQNLEREILLSYFGFLNPSKGVETLFLALAKLIEDGRKVRLLMIGDLHNGAGEALSGYAEKIRELAKELEIERFITWTGFVDKEEASSYLLSSDICVLPFRDGVSTKRSSLISCLDHGLPVVTTCNGFIPSGIEDHKNLILVPPDDEVGLARAIIELIEDEELCQRLGRGAQELVEKVYSWRVITERMVGAYEGE